MKSNISTKVLEKFRTEFDAILVYILRILGAFLTFVLQIFLARWMGQYEYGLFALVWSCIIIVGELLSFGFYNLIQRLIPEYRVKNQAALLRGALWGAAGTILVASLSISALIALAIFALFSMNTLSADYAIPLMIGTVALPAFALADYLSGIGRSYGWMVRAFSPTAIFRPLAIMGLLVGLVAYGFNSNANIAIISAVSAVWLTLLVSLFTIGKKIPIEERNGPREHQMRPWILAALPMMMISSFELLLFNVDILMLSHYLPPDQTGIYFAATKIMALVAFLNFAIGSAFTRRYAEAHASGDHAALARVIQRSATLTFYPSLLMILVILLLNKPLLSLFGEGFTEAHIVMLPLAIGLIFRALVGPGERILMMTGQQKITAVIYLGTVLADIAFNFALIPVYGILGAAIATTISFFLMGALLLITIKLRHNVISLPISPPLAALGLARKPKSS